MLDKMMTAGVIDIAGSSPLQLKFVPDSNGSL